jgi:hypothetical protein
LLACLLARVPAPVILLSDSFTFYPSNSPEITPSSRKKHALIAQVSIISGGITTRSSISARQRPDAFLQQETPGC